MTSNSSCRFARVIAVAFILMLSVGLPIDAQPPSVQVPRAVLARYVGEYLQSDGSSVHVRLRGDTLFREIPGQRAPLVPITETVFRMGPVFTAEFVLDANGGATKILSDGVAVEHRLVRRGSRASAAPADAALADTVVLPREVLEQYVGRYEYIPGQMGRSDLSMTIRLRGNTLTRTTTGLGEVTLTPLSPTKFRVGRTSLVVEFVIDEMGVTQVLGTGFQQLLARRTR